MKISLFLLLTLVSFNCFAASVTIVKDQIVGKWESHYGYGKNKPTRATLNKLEITKDFNVIFKRSFENGNIQSFKATANDIETLDDLFIFNFRSENSLSYKLVIGGWVNGSNKLLFGSLYLYENGALFNGIPVSFKPSGS